MHTTLYYVNKTSGTSADILLAVGFASLLREILKLLGKEHKGIIIRDAGPYYEITLPLAIDTDNLSYLSGLPMLLPLTSEKQRDKQAKKGGKTLDGFDYDGEMERSRSYREQIKNLPPELQTPYARLKRAPELEEIIQQEPDTRQRQNGVVNRFQLVGQRVNPCDGQREIGVVFVSQTQPVGLDAQPEPQRIATEGLLGRDLRRPDRDGNFSSNEDRVSGRQRDGNP